MIPRERTILFLIYSVGFLGGTYNHVVGVIRYGLFTVRTAPLGFTIYWDLLTLLDPLAVLLLWPKPRMGIALAVGIMISDISINSYAYSAGYFGVKPMADMVPLALLLQSVFGTFIFATAPLAYKLESQTTCLPN